MTQVRANGFRSGVLDLCRQYTVLLEKLGRQRHHRKYLLPEVSIPLPQNTEIKQYPSPDADTIFFAPRQEHEDRHYLKKVQEPTPDDRPETALTSFTNTTKGYNSYPPLLSILDAEHSCEHFLRKARSTLKPTLTRHL